MKRIGLILKEARESQGLSLEDIAARTKIHIDKLRAIESNDFNNLPAKVFIKGLIKSYARELKVDEKTVNDSCDQEFEDTTLTTTTVPHPEPIFDDEEDEKRPVGRFQAPNSFFIIVASIVVIILSIFIYAAVSKIKSYSKEETTPQKIELIKATEKIDASPDDELKDNDQKDELIIEQPKPKEKPAAKEVSKKEEAPQESTPKKEPLEAVATKEAPDQEDSTTTYSDNKLVIEAIEAVRVQITWSDGHPQVILMKEKEKKTFIFSNPLTININNGGAINIIYNNKFLGVPGTLNAPIELKYP